MAYNYKESEAGLSIIGIGETPEEAFQEGAKAMFNAIADISSIEQKNEIEIECKAGDMPSLFVEWLNALLSKKDSEKMLFSGFKAEINKEQNKYILKGKASGEKIDSKKHEIKKNVKAATYSDLKFEEKDQEFKAQCVLEVR